MCAPHRPQPNSGTHFGVPGGTHGLGGRKRGQRRLQDTTPPFPNATNVAGATSLPPSCLRVKHPSIPSLQTVPLARCPILYSWLERMCRACSPPVPSLSPPPRPVAWAISFCAVGAASPAIRWRGKSVNSFHLPSRETGEHPLPTQPPAGILSRRDARTQRTRIPLLSASAALREILSPRLFAGGCGGCCREHGCRAGFRVDLDRPAHGQAGTLVPRGCEPCIPPEGQLLLVLFEEGRSTGY